MNTIRFRPVVILSFVKGLSFVTSLSFVTVLSFVMGLSFFVDLAPGPGSRAFGQDAPRMATLRQSFLTPPVDARIMMRWWWFGPGVQKPELEREMRAMKQAGIGGFEIQPVYPLALDDTGNDTGNDTSKGFRNLPYLSDGFIDALHFANEKADELGLRVDLTLASGWPYGGAYVPVDHASSRLRIVSTPIPDGAASIAAPAIGNGESILAAFRSDGASQATKAMEQLPPFTGLRMPLPSYLKGRPADLKGQHPDLKGQEYVVFFIASRTGQMVKRAAVGADGFVIDHLDRTAVDTHLATVADRLMQAFGNHPPYAVFSDSLEVYGADWTPDFLAQFQRRRGYDLTPYLPLLINKSTPAAQPDRTGATPTYRVEAPLDEADEKTAAIRHDYGMTLTELMDDNYLTPIRKWAEAHGTRFRSQTYGDPAVTMSSNELVSLPEGEGPQWRAFSYTRWATSASHVYHRPITSAETWTWLHSPAFRAVPLDMKAEADLFFLQGVNQLIGHGWPYTPPSVAEPGWAFYAAAVFNDHNPWWIVMPDVTRYLQRSSYMLRQGEPANDVALLLPNDDAWSHFTAGHDSVSGIMPMLLGKQVIPQVLDAGFNLDYIDATAIDAVGIQHSVLVLPGVEQLPLATYQKIAAFAKSGAILVATRRLPTRAPGFKTPATDSASVKSLSHELFEAPGAPGHFVADESQLGATLDRLTKPDMQLSPATPEIGFIHRKLPDLDIYFVVNTSNRPRKVSAIFRANRASAQVWDAATGKISRPMEAKSIQLDLAPYESRFVILSNARPGPAPPVATNQRTPSPIDIAGGWEVTMPGSLTSAAMSGRFDSLHSWTEDESTRYFSGEATYVRSVEIPKGMLHPGLEVDLDFGAGAPIDHPATSNRPGTRAWIDSPIREAAEVYINGKDAGSVWHPPYTLDATGLLREGSNEIKIIVANTAINTLAGRTLPDYRLLNSRYTERFTPQDMKGLEPLPSGILGPVKLTFKPSE